MTTRGALVLAIGMTLAACDREPPIVIASPGPRRPTDGRPEGYPIGFPIVPGGRVLEGAVDEGVVRTSALEYAGPCEGLEQALRDALARVNGRVVAKDALPDGTVALRMSLADKEASFSMHAELSACILRTVASDAPPHLPR